MIRVCYKGSIFFLKPSSENFASVEDMRKKAEFERVRFEVRYGCVRTIYYYDYDEKGSPAPEK